MGERMKCRLALWSFCERREAKASPQFYAKIAQKMRKNKSQKYVDNLPEKSILSLANQYINYENRIHHLRISHRYYVTNF